MKYDSLLTLMLPVDVGANLAGLEHCRDVPLFPIISAWERSANRLKRLLSCVGMSKLLKWFPLFLATMASSHAEDRRLAKDGGEMRMYFRKRGGLLRRPPRTGTIPLTLLQRRYGRSR